MRQINADFDMKLNIPKFYGENFKDNQLFLNITEERNMNELEKKIKYFYDDCCCLDTRKLIYKMSRWVLPLKTSYVSYYCYKLVSYDLFTGFILTAVLLNTLQILVLGKSKEEQEINETLDLFFLYLYIIEALLKIMAYGFILDKNSYLRDIWNVFDFFIVLVGIIQVIISKYKLFIKI